MFLVARKLHKRTLISAKNRDIKRPFFLALNPPWEQMNQERLAAMVDLVGGGAKLPATGWLRLRRVGQKISKNKKVSKYQKCCQFRRNVDLIDWSRFSRIWILKHNIYIYVFLHTQNPTQNFVERRHQQSSPTDLQFSELLQGKMALPLEMGCEKNCFSMFQP